MSVLNGWRLPLRMARRDALRHRGRSVLVLVMISLPVLAVTTADVLISTSDVSGIESIPRRMGSAAALVTVQEGVGPVLQAPDPESFVTSLEGAAGTGMPTAEQVADELGGARLVELRTGDREVRTDKGQTPVQVTELDLEDPVTDGLFRLVSGRVPQHPGEVVVNQALVDKGYAVGAQLDLADVGTVGSGAADPVIVGVAESTTYRDFPIAAGPLGTFGVDAKSQRTWLVDGGPVGWETVLALNAIGATVASRAVITDPPPASEVPDAVSPGTTDDTMVAVVLLIVVMALIEVVLLAGPAFAVGARRQQRSLALMAAAGGTPKQSRRVIVAGALVLGGVAAAAAVAVGIGVARVLVPVLQQRSGSWLGPFDVPWLHLAGIAAFGLLSAFLAAVVPAWIASRQDVVAVLAGRRGDRPPSLRSPALGLALLGLGVAGSVYGAHVSRGELYIAASAIPAVLGMIFLVPAMLGLLARVCGRLPLVVRFAIRDAARHRTRTVPAVAAVAATVAGVVALSIGLTSDQAENEATYTPSVADGVGVVTAYAQVRWDTVRGVVAREIPGATLTEQRGLPENTGDTYGGTEVKVRGVPYLLETYGSSLGASVLVSDGDLPVGLIGVPTGVVAKAEHELRKGGAVVFVSRGVDVGNADEVRMVRTSYDANDPNDPGTRTATVVPATFVTLTHPSAGPVAIVSSAAARELGVEPATVALTVSGTDITRQQETDASEALAAVSPDVAFAVERGYQPDDSAVIAQLVLIGLGGVLMLGGTLTATFLALSDARPDLATLSAVGASPRTRRAVAASYALVVGIVGAILGAAVGFIPGVAVTYPLTSRPGDGLSGSGTGPYLDVPWLAVLGLVVALPLLTALVVGLFARSRLPLVARLD